jgi:SAM-dependent methyltransferase
VSLGYETREQRLRFDGADDLVIRLLRDDQQFDDRSGAAGALGISEAHWSLFGQLWPSCLVLADRLVARPLRAGERMLEVGCGLAVASLVAHRRGIDVTAGDIHPLAGPFLVENARRNGLPPVRYRPAPWGDPDLDLGGPFDLVVGSDVLYEPDSRGLLAAFLARQIAPGGEIWIVDPDRGNRGPFHRRMTELGFVRTEERIDEPARLSRAAYRGRLMVYRHPSGAGPARTR